MEEINEAEQLFFESYLCGLEGEAEQAESFSLYLDRRDEFSKQYSIDLVKNYYLDNPSLGLNVLNSVQSMLRVSDVDPMATLVLAITSVEVLTKNVLLKPFLMGMLHNGRLADLVTKQLLHQNGLDRFNTLLFWLFDEHLYSGEKKSVDLKMPCGTKTIWQARSELQKIRNGIVHKADSCTLQEAEKSIELYVQFDTLVSKMLASLGLAFYITLDEPLVITQSSSKTSRSILEALSHRDELYSSIPNMDFGNEIPY
ncbi:hypothetical protein [Vibrio caribbeanicus]|uniref:hypothetical protein n=1 Tax=Vibrio caribbeanicus TaxID=701175 RepID=UPI0022839D38|nr:hypothetical protein [Vibrio caribbeanicus]MCY9844542.1 hypothetical protein [Vibrio caribbeanicus]